MRRQRRSLLAAGVAAAALAATVTSGDKRQGTDRFFATVEAQAGQPGRSGGATYFVDPATGQPREPTPQDLLELQGDRGIQAAVAPQPIVASGLEGLQLTDAEMTYTVAIRKSDGTVAIEHAAGGREARRLVATGNAETVLQAGKEQPRDR